MGSNVGRISGAGIACFCLALVAGGFAPAKAGEIGDAAAAAEALLPAGDAAAIWGAFNRATELFWAEAPMAFRVAVLAESVGGFGQYEPRATAVFAPGETLTAYLEPVGYGWTPIGAEFRIRLVLDVAIATEAGDIVAAEEGYATLERYAVARTREFQATVVLTLPALRPGGYVLSLTFDDAASGKSATATFPFTVAE